MGTYKDMDGDSCGPDYPSSANLANGVGTDGSGRTCDKAPVDKLTPWPPKGTGVNSCNVHRGGAGGGKKITNFKPEAGKLIKMSDVMDLRTKIGEEVNGAWGGAYKGGISDHVKVGELNALVEAIRGAYNNAGQEAPTMESFSPDGIEAVKIKQLIDGYNEMIKDCVCNSNWGSEQTCTCHNNCGCHY